MLGLSDDELVRSVEAGEEDGARMFVDRFRLRIEAILRRRRVPSGDRDDVVQQVLTDALRQIREARFRRESTLQTWLHTIVNGKAADYWRKRGPEMVSLQMVADDDPAFVATSLDNDQVLAVQQALSSLAAEDQVLLLLHDAERYTLNEIGGMMGLRKSAVAKRLERARGRFRAAISGGGNWRALKRLKE